MYQNEIGHRRFVHHLYHHCLPVDLWDGDSLCLLGSAELPLRVMYTHAHARMRVHTHTQTHTHTNTLTQYTFKKHHILFL